MKKLTLTPLCLAIGMAFAVPASMAATIDFSGSNIYMKFLDGDRQVVSSSSGDTASGTDTGQWTEFELRMKATISPQVEAGVRLQSRSPSAYWTQFGGFSKEGNNNDTELKYIKLRGAYVQLTPGYSWLNTALIGSSDWGMFDPFTVGKIRYIDRDNINGFYFKGPLLGKASYEIARISRPEYLGPNFDTGYTSNVQDATYIGQIKGAVGGMKLTGSFQQTSIQTKDYADTTPLNGTDYASRSKNSVFALKAEGALSDAFDVRGAYYRSHFAIDNAQVLADWAAWGGLPSWCGGQSATTGACSWGMTPGRNVDDHAIKLDVDWGKTPIAGLSANFQYFNIGAGYVTLAGSRRETDTLLTEGSEAAWANWGNSLWLGGRANDMTQTPVIHADNAFTDFEETGSESSIGWKGFTMKLNYETSDTPMSLELTKIGYNTNWQNYGGDAATYDVGHGQGTYDVYKQYQDRSTNIAVFKASHLFPNAGGLETGFKWKRVSDSDKVNTTVAADDVDVTDNGYVFSVGKQLYNDLNTTVSYGRYTRDQKVGSNEFNTDKNILSLKASYNLTGLEIGALAQWIKGSGFPDIANPRTDFEQYRMKAYLKAIF